MPSDDEVGDSGRIEMAEKIAICSLAFMTAEVDGTILLVYLQVMTSKNFLSFSVSQPLTSHMTRCIGVAGLYQISHPSHT